ncbi:MAG: 5-methyltetrahydrofolate--homocysteine methyltransferase [Candidatus Diapherotrites archaeon CG08_land_8_20_14_0_20_34_12]|nr:MAG: 5-methyltetrahydrofolate--homocysteine methyltransferase [Candidatus Diapherotrites archaeon CG08_land_8_20_14_0_20_34_12]
MNILKEMQDRILILDGAMGTMIQSLGYNERLNELLNLKKPDVIEGIYKAYLDAGADIIETNTFSANRIKLSEFNLQDKIKEINETAVEIARKAAKSNAFVAADISFSGKYIEPLGNLTFDQAYENYAEQISYLKKADILLVETLMDIKDLKTSLIAAQDNWKKPIFCSMTFDTDRTSTGTDVKSYLTVAESFDVDAVGVNCGDPKLLIKIVEKMCQNTNKPVLVYPNAGIPKLLNGKTVFDVQPRGMVHYAKKFASFGANIIGGCCGTTPLHIKEIANAVKHIKPKKRNNEIPSRVCSASRTIEFGKKVIIGESINPTNKKDLEKETLEGKTSLMKTIALEEKKAGADILDVNVCIPLGNEEIMLPKAVLDIGSAVDLPLCLDSKNIKALENALKKCSGKPIINSVDGEKRHLENILPLAKRYGASVIALTLDNKGIPKTANERLKIAKRILGKAEKIGLSRKDILVDTLAITLAVNENNAKITLDAIKKVKNLGLNTVLGVSNISHGLPNRRQINFSFLVDALNSGLDAAILNPFDSVMVEAMHDAKRFSEKKSIEKYMQAFKEKKILNKKRPIKEQLKQAIVDGLDDSIESLIHEALAEFSPFEVNNYLIEGMEIVGKRFKGKKIFLPSVLISASAMKKATGILNKKIKKKKDNKSKIVFATVKNDIHDLGKNIVITLLESHGFNVTDLGADVSEKKIVEVATKEHADIVCLSALMTTTMIEMPKVIAALRNANFNKPIMIGGAIVNQKFAEQCGAYYARNAVEGVDKIKEILAKN